MNEELSKLLQDIRHETHLMENRKSIKQSREEYKKNKRQKEVDEAIIYTHELISKLPEFNTYEFLVEDPTNTDPEGSVLIYKVEIGNNTHKGSFFELKRMGYISLHGLYDIVEPDKIKRKHVEDAYIAFMKDSIRLLTELKDKLIKSDSD